VQNVPFEANAELKHRVEAARTGNSQAQAWLEYKGPCGTSPPPPPSPERAENLGPGGIVLPISINY